MSIKERLDFLQKLNAAFIVADTEFMSLHLADDVTWSIVGSRKIYGKTGFINFLKSEKNQVKTAKTIERIISEGSDISVTGMLYFSRRGKTNSRAYHDVYRFTREDDGKILEMTSFEMENG